jgi:hypothetical protein
MNFLVGYHLDKSTYYPMEDGKLIDLKVINDSEYPVQIEEVAISFECDWGFDWFQSCSIKIQPNAKANLPSVNFGLDYLGIPEGALHFKPSIKYRSYEKGEWKKKSFKSSKGDFIEIKYIPNADFKIFISHSNDEEDIPLLTKLVDSLNPIGVEGYYAESDVDAGTRLWDKIEREIRESDAFLVLWTMAASKSKDVREEIGIAIGAKKKILIPVVESNVEVVGSIKARQVEWIAFNPSDPEKCLKKILQFIVKKSSSRKRNI